MIPSRLNVRTRSTFAKPADDLLERWDTTADIGMCDKDDHVGGARLAQAVQLSLHQANEVMCAQIGESHDETDKRQPTEVRQVLWAPRGARSTASAL